ncbi:MFS general substrate transporter [Gigaspora margarita]|uniref:MFS-type drug efflux transporter P55 n=1 Tax=Gigaspora margarita TaxID=4874 RepID=A0A8H4ARP2_GIGMA|nr:MFS general substrate transporter [Gigaspora margarita]
MVCQTSFQPIYGALSDIFGRKATLLFAIVIFELGSFLCGISYNMISLIICRAIAGIGGGGIIGLVIIIISEIVSIKDRGKFQGIIHACYAIASVAGPLLGGVFTDYVNWRWCFFINLPIGAIAITIIIFLLHLPKPTGSLLDKFKRIDIIGNIIIISSTVCILLSLSWGGSNYAWDSPVIIVLLCVGILGYTMFGLVENYIAVKPIAPPYLFKNFNVVSCFLLNMFMGMVKHSYVFYAPLYFQVVKAESATQSGLDFMPYFLGLTICSIISGQLFSRTNKIQFRIVIIFASILVVVGAGLTTMWNENSGYAELSGFMIIGGAGIGLIAPSTILCIQELVERKNIASVTILSLFFRAIGSVFGITISGSAFNNKLSQLISTLPSYFSTQSIYNIQLLPPDARTLIIHVYALAFRFTFELILLYIDRSFYSTNRLINVGILDLGIVGILGIWVLALSDLDIVKTLALSGSWVL